MKEVPNCDLVTERVALGEPLGMLEQHVATCESCAKLALVPSQIATTAIERPDPGLGFSARMTIGAQHKLAVRRRRRIAGTAAAGVAAAAIGVFVATRSPSGPEQAPLVGTEHKQEPIVISNEELAGLVKMADTDRAMRVSAPWGRIQRPLAPYIKLVKGVTP